MLIDKLTLEGVESGRADTTELFCLIPAISKIRCADELIVEVNGNVSVSLVDSVYLLSMNENNHDFDKETPHVPLFRVVQANSLPTISFTQATFRYSIVEDPSTAGSYIFYADQSFDYETQEHTYVFNILINNDFPPVTLNIINIDDERPSLTAPQCSFDENTIYTFANTTCSCTVSDPDGWLDQMTFEIVLTSSIDHDEALIFALDYREQPPDNVYNETVYVAVQRELNYQEITFYLFDIRAQDGVGHSTTPNELVRAIINVNDLPDTPPEWTHYFSSQQFDEQTEQTFYVTARDGDYGLDYEINYMKLWEDDEEADYISIDEKSGTINVKKIDRDKDDISTYSFEVMAYEVPDKPVWNNTLAITFYIIDIDNNPPLVRWVEEADKTNRTFDNVEEKLTSMSFLENYAGDLNLTIFIKDIDTGENAQFTVELENLEENDISYTDAFLIVPTAGYRSGQFQISVRDASYLDYEVPEWIHISFNVLTKGTLDPTKTDRMLVEITLIDYNDEWPIFPEIEYSIEINETAKNGEVIMQIMATDRDAEDKDNLTHTLIGSSYTSRVLAIDTLTGNITVNADNAFDYDTVNPIFIQVRATDHANHTATVPLTINLLDVNNKAPTISVGDPINVDENQNSATKLDSTITASDMDTTANLSATIDWSRSYAMKNSRRLDMTNDTISQQVRFLNVEYYRKDEDDDDNRDIIIDLVVNDNNPDGTTPDFELFDSLYISLVVIDWNTDPEFPDKVNTSVLILISINDINDNTPFFPEANLPESERENRTIQENAPEGISAGSIVAIDLDVDDTVTYNCTALDPNFDWVTVNTDTGSFTVKAAGLINADIPKTFYFNYSCTASDDNHTHTSDPLIVRFYIIDTNNRRPTITIDDKVYVDEKSPNGTVVSEVETEDEDRDIPFHTVACSFDRETTCIDKFIIINNVIQVRNGYNDIDRDEGDKNYTCPMTCEDNPDRLQNDQQGPHSEPATVVIILNDINDHTPVVLNDAYSATENVHKDDVIGTIVAEDKDEGLNAEIVFNVTKVKASGGEDVTDLFGVTTDEDYVVDLTHKQANLVALKDLRGAYGEYVVTIGVADKGDPPNSALYDITVEVTKFNFAKPKFVFPSGDGQSFALFSSQELESRLILFSNEDTKYLEDFSATDSESDEQICGKWDIDIDFEQLSPEDERTIFVMTKPETCKGQLQINNRFDPDFVLGKTYKLKLTASVKDGEPEEGEAAYTAETTITISFVDNNLQPTFNCSSMEFSFREEFMDQSQELLCSASYQLEDNTTLPIFYYLDPKAVDDTIENTFNVDVATGTISLKQVISYKRNKNFQFSVVASNDTSPTSTNSESFLNITCNVIETNINWPQWTRKTFFGAIMSGYIRNTPVLTVEATDADEIDQDQLTYNINGSISSSDSSLNNVPSDAFLITKDTGEIRLNFQVESTMVGYFQFDVTVWDVEDDFHNGNLSFLIIIGPHWNTTSVTVFIITRQNTVDFRFYNPIGDVQNKENEMLQIVSEVIGYEAYRQNIEKQTQDGAELEDQSYASLFFINVTTTEAIEANTILRSVSNINTFSNLAGQLRNRTGLILMSFPSTSGSSENLEGVLQAWLVGVSVVLGALCLILLVTFVLKTRELNRRIKLLTTNKFGSQESGLNRLGVSAPTTNKHAIEGSNPIFNVNGDGVKKELGNRDDFDRSSIRSGDSDLIGIEDNPEFDYNDKSNIKKVFEEILGKYGDIDKILEERLRKLNNNTRTADSQLNKLEKQNDDLKKITNGSNAILESLVKNLQGIEEELKLLDTKRNWPGELEAAEKSANEAISRPTNEDIKEQEEELTKWKKFLEESDGYDYAKNIMNIPHSVSNKLNLLEKLLNEETDTTCWEKFHSDLKLLFADLMTLLDLSAFEDNIDDIKAKASKNKEDADKILSDTDGFLNKEKEFNDIHDLTNEALILAQELGKLKDSIDSMSERNGEIIDDRLKEIQNEHETEMRKLDEKYNVKEGQVLLNKLKRLKQQTQNVDIAEVERNIDGYLRDIAYYTCILEKCESGSETIADCKK
ncbi:hypothetical protein NQ315_008462 [Exocentrus adspersus]|uniref:Cadherin domain-containing protein n=1 Tax=Exocentrus adspersus TaxID=1586481 RepID=A0AAV8W725_9CUCU|nr:hypothetical protein NQ315_008462 [Exocentrus adspersus]